MELIRDIFVAITQKWFKKKNLFLCVMGSLQEHVSKLSLLIMCITNPNLTASYIDSGMKSSSALQALANSWKRVDFVYPSTLR